MTEQDRHAAYLWKLCMLAWKEGENDAERLLDAQELEIHFSAVTEMTVEEYASLYNLTFVEAAWARRN